MVTRLRRTGIAIVDTKKGILLVAGRGKVFSLPGGGADRGESRKHATMRELKEETTLRTKKRKFLFPHRGRKWHSKGKAVRNDAKVFLIKTSGYPKPSDEIKHIKFWKQGSKLKTSRSTKAIISKYLKQKIKR